MKRPAMLLGAYLVDQIAGDPEWFPHPVRLVGRAIARGEATIRRPGQTNECELASGAALTAVVVATTYTLTATIIAQAHRRSRALGNAIELLLAWTCLAARNLEDEASSVIHALRQDDLALARHRLSRIVGRDTAHLDAEEISRAVIETLAESASDGIVAPMFYMALGGIPLAMAYKAINTLDSMIGHADTRYFYFGKAAARLDDVANYLPSRVTALAIIATSSHPHSSWRIWHRDGSKHKSPNAGQPEAAIAGALHVTLGGSNTYAGELIRSPGMGEEFPAATPAKAAQAIRLVAKASLLCLALCAVAATMRKHD